MKINNICSDPGIHAIIQSQDHAWSRSSIQDLTLGEYSCMRVFMDFLEL